MYRYKEVFRKEINYFSLFDLKRILLEVVPAGTKDEDVLLEIDKETYTGYYDDFIVETYLVISVREK